MSKHRTAPQSFPMSPRSMTRASPATSRSSRALAPVPPATPATTSRPSVSIILVYQRHPGFFLRHGRWCTEIDQQYANNLVFLGDATAPHSPPSTWMSSPATVVAHSSRPRTRPSSSGLWVSSARLHHRGRRDRQYLLRRRRQHRSHRRPANFNSFDTDAFRKATLHTPPRGGSVADRPGNPRPVFVFRNPSPATTSSGTASSLDIGGGIREGVATWEGEASSGPASRRDLP